MVKVKIALRIILLLAGVGILGFILYSCMSAGCRQEAINPTTPGINEAPFKVTVHSTGNIYYAKVVVSVGGVHELKGFWEQENEVYIFKDITVRLDGALFGEITVERRK